MMAKTIPLWRQALIAAGLLLGAFGLWFAAETTLGRFQAATDLTPSGKGAAAVRVAVASVNQERDDLLLETIGTGRALRTVTLRVESAGKVVEMNLAAGERFKRGDLLVRLDDRNARLAVELAETRLREAKRVYERTSQLQGRGAAAVASLDAARTAAEVAEIELRSAREALTDRDLRAPFDGVSAFPEIEVGDWIDADDAVAMYDDRSRLLIEFDAPELALARLRLGQKVRVETVSAAGVGYVGEIAAIDSRVDADNRTARVRVAVENGEDRLRPGASFAVRLELPGETYPTVPELALQFSREGLNVWRVVDDKAVRVPVRLIRRRAGRVLVEGALSPGDAVVIEGAQRLAPGRAVRVAADPAARAQ